MKNIFKMFGIIALVAVIGLSMAACIPVEKDADGDGDGNSDGNDGGSTGGGIKPTITIKNNTGYTIGAIFAKPSTETKEWGWDLTGWNDMEDGKSGEYTLDQPLTVHKVYDIRLSGGGYDFVKFGVTVSNKMTITFTVNDLNNMSSLPKITIQNRTGKNFDSLFIVPSELQPSKPEDWGKDFGGIGNNGDKGDINILVAPTNYTVFDIQARSSNPTNTYNKKNVTITNGTTILITSADKEREYFTEWPVIVIQNNTGYKCDVFIKESGTTEWGDDLTPWGGLPWMNDWLYDGKSQTFSFLSLSSWNQIDIKLHNADSDSINYIKLNQQMIDGMVYTFTAGDVVTP